MIDRIMKEMCLAADLATNEVRFGVGVIMSVPRACMRADRISAARGIGHLSFDTDMLTQLCYGASKDDSHLFMVIIVFINAVLCLVVGYDVFGNIILY